MGCAMTSPRDIASQLVSAATNAHHNQEYSHCDTYALLAQVHLLSSIDQTLGLILAELRKNSK